jgi:FkbM family methyltransferase
MRVANAVALPPPPPTLAQLRYEPWRDADGDRTHRVNYDLNARSIVFDLGGYRGDWASDIFSRFCCTIHVFEAVPDYAAGLVRRFERNTSIHIYPFGLASADSVQSISVAEERSSAFAQGGRQVEMKLVRAADFFTQHAVDHIDLMKVNIEGGEYDLVEHLIAASLITKIANLQVQFHDIFPDAEARMQAIQASLRCTHELTYQFPFMWENWRIKSADSA